MRRCTMTILTILMAVPACWAQADENKAPEKATSQATSAPADRISPRAVATTPPIQKEYKIRYVLWQLHLSKKQEEQAEGLIQTVYNQEVNLDIERVRDIMVQMQEAKANGDDETYKKLEGELRAMGQQATHEPEFYDNLSLNLSDEQRETLKRARERLESNPSGALRPVDIFDEAARLNLTPEQQKTLQDQREAFRGRIERMGSQSSDNFRNATMLDGLYTHVKEMLNDAQRAKYEAVIERMRTDKFPLVEQMDTEFRKGKARAREQRHPAAKPAPGDKKP